MKDLVLIVLDVLVLILYPNFKDTTEVDLKIFAKMNEAVLDLHS